ncbi:MAG: FAD-dependent oxidoreductase, partial [Bacteroidota bacterium]
TGSRTRSLGVQGENARNVFHVKTLDDGYGIKRFIEEEKPKRAVVIGGGYIGMEMCEALRMNGMETTMLHRSDLPMSGLERETRAEVLSALKKGGVDFRPSQQITEFNVDQSGKVTEVRASSGTIPADLVILCLGVVPNAELATTARLRLGPNGGILTDQRQTTSIDTIFAAGDCCEVKNIVNNKWMYVPLATNASKQGWVAGENAAGGNASFKGAIRAIAVKVFDLEVAQVGISSAEADESGFQPVVEKIDGDSRVRFYPGNSAVHVILIADKKSGILLGANVYGGPGSVLRADVLAVAIQQKMTVDEVTRLDLIYAPPFSPLWDPILIAAQQTQKKLNSKRKT